jgi:hypothetical protein
MALKGYPHVRPKANPCGFARIATTFLLLVSAGVGLMIVGLQIAAPDSPEVVASQRTAETTENSLAVPAAVSNEAVDIEPVTDLPETPPGTRYAFAWPAPGSISQGISATHGGIDVRAATGDEITAVRAGTVRFAGGDPCCVYGYHIIVDHDEGWSTLYGHLSEFSVKEGDGVLQGDVLGLAGNTGRSDGAHLHLELWSFGGVVNPLSYLEPRRYYVPEPVQIETVESTATPEPLPRDFAIDRAVRWMEGAAGDYAVQRSSCFAITTGPNWSVSCSATLLGCQADVCEAILEACVVGPLLLVEATCDGYSTSGTGG